MAAYSYIQRHNDDKGMTRDEIIKTSGTLIIAGSETTATLLSGATFHLLKNPDVLQRLKDELRSKFSAPTEITFQSLSHLPYLNACLQEAFRMYPPVPGVLPRRTLPEGAVINGYFIPANVGQVYPIHTLSNVNRNRRPSESINGARITRSATL